MPDTGNAPSPAPGGNAPPGPDRIEFLPRLPGPVARVSLALVLLGAALLLGASALRPMGWGLRLVLVASALLCALPLGLMVVAPRRADTPWVITDAGGITFPWQDDLYLPWSRIRRVVLDRASQEGPQLYLYLNDPGAAITDHLTLALPLSPRQREGLVEQLRLALPAGAVLVL